MLLPSSLKEVAPPTPISASSTASQGRPGPSRSNPSASRYSGSRFAACTSPSTKALSQGGVCTNSR